LTIITTLRILAVFEQQTKVHSNPNEYKQPKRHVI